jgi:hypothetical protein
LLQVQLDLDPGTASLANLVPETGAFADQSVEAEILGLYQSSSMSLVKLI